MVANRCIDKMNRMPPRFSRRDARPRRAHRLVNLKSTGTAAKVEAFDLDQLGNWCNYDTTVAGTVDLDQSRRRKGVGEEKEKKRGRESLLRLGVEFGRIRACHDDVGMRWAGWFTMC
jgi:hypothetical protein